TLTANMTVGSYNVTATAGALTANFSLTNLPGPPASITATQGTPQPAQVTASFATALKVVVRDASSNPIPGASVTFAAPVSGASATFGGAATVVTDAAGIATAPALSANTIAGSYAVTATTSALSTAFNLTNTAGPAANVVIVQGDAQSAAQ